jgi:hypothetical protein
MKTYIKIEDNKPFRAEWLNGTGILWGYRDATQPIDQVKGALSVTHVARAHYSYRHKGQTYENDMYYRYGKRERVGWRGVCFHVWGLLA